MTARTPYDYAVLRYVPDIAVGEFVNIGVVVIARQAYGSSPRIEAKFDVPQKRLHAMFPQVSAWKVKRDLATITAAYQALHSDKSFFRFDQTARQMLDALVPPSDGCLQWSDVAVGLADDLAQTADRLFRRYVTQAARAPKRRSDDDVWRRVEQQLRTLNVPVEFQPEVVVGKDDNLELRKTWRNGSLHAYEPLSLDLANADEIRDKARRWRGAIDAASPGHDLRLHFIVAPPSNESLMPDYDAAIRILHGATGAPEIVLENAVPAMVQQLASIAAEHYNHV